MRALLTEKVGRDAAARATEDAEGAGVPDRVRRKLRVEPPSAELVESYLSAIATAYDIPYGDTGTTTTAADEDDDEGEGGGTGQAERVLEAPLEAGSAGTPSTPAKQSDKPAPVLKEMSPPPGFEPSGARSPVSIAPPSPSTDNANPKVRLPGAVGGAVKPRTGLGAGKTGASGGGAAKKKPEGEVPDVDDLEKRFAMLKR